MMESFLTDRTANLQLNETKLEIHVEKGCPRGSPLSPFLWNIVLDKALRLNLGQGIMIQAYADDIIVATTGRNVNSIILELQNACDVLQNWSKSVKLEFSGQKKRTNHIHEETKNS